MVKKLFTLAAVLLVITVIPCLGEDKCTKPTEFTPRLCPIKFAKIKTIRIEENGARSFKDYEPILDCSIFIFTEEKVRQYFSMAMTTDRMSSSNVLSWSPCYVSGTLTFENGRTASWSINQGKGARITENGWEDNKSEDLIYLYCPKCNFEPFTDESEYENDDEDEDEGG